MVIVMGYVYTNLYHILDLLHVLIVNFNGL